mgnify:CR=1 FL=1
MIEVSTSILNVKEKDSVKTFYDLETAKTNFFHIDVMDGKFVDNNTAKRMLEYATNIKQISNVPLDVHLMVEDTKKYIDDYLALEPMYITVHKEAFKSKEEFEEIILYIKENRIKVGVAIKPETKVEEIYEILPYIHLILVMTVEPGKGGQGLIPATISKIAELSNYRQENNLDFYIEADGGINEKTINQVREAGTDIVVAGTAIVNAENYKIAIQTLKKESSKWFFFYICNLTKL